MLACLEVNVGASQAEINHMNDVRLLAHTHHDVVGFDVTMNHTTFVHELKTLQYLRKQHQAGLERELSPAVIKQVFQCGTQQLAHHEDVLLLHQDAMLVQGWKPNRFKFVQGLKLHEQLREAASHRFCLDSNLSIVLMSVQSKEDFAK